MLRLFSADDHIIEHVGVEVDPEAVERRSAKPAQRVARRVGCALPPNGVEVDDLDARILDALAAVVIGVLRITAAEHDNILVSNERPSRLVTRSGPRPVTSAKSIDAASPFGSASG